MNKNSKNLLYLSMSKLICLLNFSLLYLKMCTKIVFYKTFWETLAHQIQLKNEILAIIFLHS